MGYDVNYNQLDYAQAHEICQQVTRELAGVREQVLAALRIAARCQNELATVGMAAGTMVRSPSLDALDLQLRVGMMQAGSLAIESQELTEAMGQAGQNYESAENRVEHQILASTFVQKVGEVIQDIRNNNMRPPTVHMETILRLLMISRPDLALGWDESFGDQVEHQTKELAEFIRYFSSHRDTDIVITEQDPVQLVQVSGGMESYFELHSMLEGQGPEENGKFMVVEADENTYVVILPGTQERDGFKNGFDEWGIVDGLGRESENYVGVIDDAIEASGAREGDEIILSGYSQGGIHVAQLMRNKFLNRKYKMNKMITLGSPIGNIDIPDHVRSLSIEDSRDMVPGTDGTPNKNRGRNHFTTIFDGPKETTKPQLEEHSLFGTPHQLKNYGDHLRELDEKPKPEIQEQLRQFHLPRAPLKARKFKIERVRRPKAKRDQQETVQKLKTMAPPH